MPILSRSSSRPGQSAEAPKTETPKQSAETPDRWLAFQRAGYIRPEDAIKPLEEIPSIEAALERANNSRARSGSTASRSRSFLTKTMGAVRNTAVRAATGLVSTQLEKSMGLSIDRLLDFDKFLLENLRISHGQPTRLLAQLIAPDPFIYVQLGLKSDATLAGAEKIMEEAARKLVAGTYGKAAAEIPPGLPPQFHGVWQRLAAKFEANEPLVEIALGPDFRKQTPLDLMAHEAILSARQHGPAMKVAVDREAGYWIWSDPWYQENRPHVHKRIEEAKAFVAPPWLNGRPEEPFGYNVDGASAKKAYQAVMGPLLGEDGSVNIKKASKRDVEDFLDIVASLHQDTLSGVQSYWVKFLRELEPTERRTILATLTHATSMALFTGGLDVIGPDGYLRSEHLIDILREALNGLGHSDRKYLSWMVLRNLNRNEDLLQSREGLAKKIVKGYKGMDLTSVAQMPKVTQALAKLEIQTGLEAGADTLSKAQPAKMEDRQEIRRHEATLRLLHELAMKPSQIDFVGFDASQQPKQPVIVGEYYAPARGRAVIEPAMVAEPPPGPKDSKQFGISVVLEGGGGKGFAYPELLCRLDATLKEVPGAKVDEFVGTSAGAITAGLLASGYSPNELKDLLPKLSFTKFYADFVGLDGGVDGKVRGIDRNGLFSTRTMYEMISDLLSKKLGIEGRPVFFSDLPQELKVMSMVVGGDLPSEAREKLGIGPDGMIEFSKTKTPHMDVAAAMVASAAVPVVFHSPQVHVCIPDVTFKGEPTFRQFRLQLADGGALNNLPEDRATQDPDKKNMMVVMPAYTQTTDKAGPILETLDFAPKGIDKIDAYNGQRFDVSRAGLVNTLKNASENGYGRATIAFNLTTPAEQKYPVLLGGDEKSSVELQSTARNAGFKVLGISEGKKLIDDNSNVSQGLKDVAADVVFKTLLDNDEKVLGASFGFGKRSYRPPRRELRGMWDVVRSVAAGALTGRAYDDDRRFDSPQKP